MTFSDIQSAALHMISKHDGTLAVTDLGHAYGKSKFASRCKLTGMNIQWGEAIRRIEVITQHGTRWEGYTSNQIFATLCKHGANSIYADIENGDTALLTVSRWSKCGTDWVERLAETMEAATEGTNVRVMDKDGQEKAWTLRGSEWHGTGYTRLSTKKVLSGLRRSTRYRLHMVSVPR
jgi:hypothetical protein